MLNQELVARLNAQVNHELHNFLQYKLIARMMTNLRLKNLAKFFEEQAKGEFEHFSKFVDYLTENHEFCTSIVPEPQEEMELSSLPSVPDLYLKIESNTTLMLTNMMALAKKLGDEKTQAWLQWALEEQVEEEDQARMLIALAGQCQGNWVLIDLSYGG
jgi:ferritin